MMTMYLVTKTKALIGTVQGDDAKGWRFFPNNTANAPGRKTHKSAVKAIPEWAFDMSDDLLTLDEWRRRA